MIEFMFATGIENSYPKIAGGVRVDEMEKCGHYRLLRNDFAAVAELGIRYLRWGPALYRTFRGPGRFDSEWTDAALAEMRRLQIEPIVDLCHFGVPDWLGDFQNPEFPEFFAEYAAQFARRYPWIRLWTPINEPLITSLFSAKYGWWNERLTSDHAFVRATINICRATRLAMYAIRRVVPDAIFVQSESCEYTHPAGPSLRSDVDFLNERRFLPLDLIYGRPMSPVLADYVASNGARADDIAFFSEPLRDFNCILGTDYYAQNEYMLSRDGTIAASGEVLGYHAIASHYYERYRLPLMHTETNISEELGSVQWLKKQFHSAQRLADDDIPVVGFTWYSLTDQMDWDTALRDDARRVNSVGLLDLERRPRPVAAEYRRLMTDWADGLLGEAAVAARAA